MTWPVLAAAAKGVDLASLEALDEVAQGFLDWYSSGPADIGNQTLQVLGATLVEERGAPATRLETRRHRQDETTPRGLVEEDFLAVAPYNVQVLCIRDALVPAGLGVRMGSVDKFQGQQAPVVLLSMRASSHGDVPRGMDFLLSRNRVYVDVSRAKWRAIIVPSDALTAFMPSSVHGLLELGAFIGLCRQ
ncbi:AAA domain-containing protein [Janibacter hoylei]